MEHKKDKILIDEQDIFNYVFYPELVSVDKKARINVDATFDEAIEFYQNLKNNSTREQSNSIKKLMTNKIPAYSFANIINLFPLKAPTIERRKEGRLAAGSVDLSPQMITKTFVDNEKEYLIKVLSYEGATKIFVFSTNDEVVKDFDIIIEPQNLKYHCEDNSEPLKIEQRIEAEKLQLSFNK